jgi:AraC-like DNA-binding protein
MKKTVTGVLIALPIIIVLLCRLMTEEKTIDLLHDKSFDMVNFVDSTNGGCSTVNIDRREDLTTLNLMLKEGFDYPYAGVIIYKIDRHRFSIRNYHFKLRVKANNDLRISLRFNQILQGYSSKNDCDSRPIFTKSIGLHKGYNTINLPSNEVNEVPDWWVRNNIKAMSLVNEVTLDSTLQVELLCDKNGLTPLNKAFRLGIDQFMLKKDFDWTLSLILAALYYAILSVLYLIKRKREITDIVIAETKPDVKLVLAPVEKIETEDRKQKGLNDLMNFIGCNFGNANLKLADVATYAGMSENAVSETLRIGTGKNFRQYLNFVRMNEAARLLKQSELQIAEIATAVGYNNTQNFNRIFKEFFEVSPKQYRG